MERRETFNFSTPVGKYFGEPVGVLGAPMGTADHLNIGRYNCMPMGNNTTTNSQYFAPSYETITTTHPNYFQGLNNCNNIALPPLYSNTTANLVSWSPTGDLVVKGNEKMLINGSHGYGSQLVYAGCDNHGSQKPPCLHPFAPLYQDLTPFPPIPAHVCFLFSYNHNWGFIYLFEYWIMYFCDYC